MFTYYSETGIASKGTLSDAPEGFYVYRSQPEGDLSDSLYDIQLLIHSNLMNLIDLMIERIFGSSSDYCCLESSFPIGLMEGGLSPEIGCDRDSFASRANRFSFEEARRMVYFADLRYLAESFVEAYNQAADSLKMAFCVLSEVDPVEGFDSGVHRVSSPQSRWMMREVESFVIRLYSSLDILSRLLSELKSIPDEFESFKKIRFERSALYSSYRWRSPHACDEGHIFNVCPETSYLEDMRNEIVHNRAFDSSATCYVRLEGGVVKERFFLLPDSEENGRLTRWKGRCRFYSQEKKGAPCLSRLYREISMRISNSLIFAIDDLSSEIEEMRTSGKLREMSSEEMVEVLESIQVARSSLFAESDSSIELEK